MEENYLYKTRVSLMKFDLLFLVLLAIASWFIHIYVGLVTLLLLIVSVANVLNERVYIYRDRIEYKKGFFLQTFCKIIPLNRACTISYRGNLLGTIFNYGDLNIGTYTEASSVRISGVKNAKMLCENIKTLISEDKG